MAKTTIAKYTSDISGDDIDSESPTVLFAFDGTHYEIDLTESERGSLTDSLAPYIKAGRKAGRNQNRSRSASTTNGPAPKEIREWARAQKLDVPERGRIPASVVEAYSAAH